MLLYTPLATCVVTLLQAASVAPANVPMYKMFELEGSITIGVTPSTESKVQSMSLITSSGRPVELSVQFAPPSVLFITRNKCGYKCAPVPGAGSTPNLPPPVTYSVRNGPVVHALPSSGGETHERGSGMIVRRLPAE